MSMATEIMPRLSHANTDRDARYRKAYRIEKVLAGRGLDLAKCSVLDIGTGSGTIASYVSRKVRSLVSVDVVDERIDMDFQFVRIGDERLPFKDETFDVVISNHVIEHVGDSNRHLREIARVLKPGGVCLLATPNRLWPIEPHFGLPALAWLPTQWLRDLYVRVMRKGKRYDVTLCTPTVLTAKARAAGLLITDASFDLTRVILGEKAVRAGSAPVLARPTWPALRSLLPSLVVFLQRPNVSGELSNTESSNDPVKRFRRQNYFLGAWRIGSYLHQRNIPVLPVLWRVACQVVFHADVPPQVRIPEGVVFMHNGLGAVVHTNVVFRGPAIVYHNVTIGMSHRLNDGAPVIGTNVLIGANAVIIGPIEVGDNSIVAAGAVVTRSVPSGYMAAGNPAVLKPANQAVLQSLFGQTAAGGVAETVQERAA